jgi:hypothetical protein
MTTIQKKLNPARFRGMSGKMAAIVAYIMDIPDATDPAIDDMMVTSDGGVLAQHEGDVGMNHFIGHVSDLRSNWTRLLDATTDLTAKERQAAMKAFREKVGSQAAGGLQGLGDSPNYEWWRQNGRNWKAKITRGLVLVKTNPRKALQMANELFAVMDEHGYPDEWHRVEALKRDAEFAMRRGGLSGCSCGR